MKISLKSLGIGAFLTSSIFFLSLFAVHLLQPDFDPISRTYSDYVLGQYGYIVSISLVSVGISQLLLAASCSKLFKSKLLFTLFICSGLGGVMTGMFPTTATKDMNFLRSLHIIGAALLFSFLPWGFIQLSKLLQKGLLKNFFLLKGILTLTLFALFGSFFIFGIDKKIGYFGLIEKIDIFLLVTGLLVMSSSVIHSLLKPSLPFYDKGQKL